MKYPEPDTGETTTDTVKYPKPAIGSTTRDTETYPEPAIGRTQEMVSYLEPATSERVIMGTKVFKRM